MIVIYTQENSPFILRFLHHSSDAQLPTSQQPLYGRHTLSRLANFAKNHLVSATACVLTNLWVFHVPLQVE
jgi:hypothetical protein